MQNAFVLAYPLCWRGACLRLCGGRGRFLSLLFVLVHIVALVFGTWVSAENLGNLRFGFGASSLGPTAEFAYRFHPSFSIRAVAGGAATFNEQIDIDSNSYDVNFSPDGVGLMVDWHTGLAGLRVSGGVFRADATTTGVTTASSELVINGTTYPETESVQFDLSARNDISPALTLGYDHLIGESWVLSAEAGALFNGGLVASARSRNGTIPASDLDTEAQAIEADLDPLGAYPYVSISFGLRF